MDVRACGDYEPVKMEERILAYWRENGIMQKTLADGDDVHSFLEGPPTANASPALHHVEVRVFKDLVNRFRFMKGKKVPRKAGWDCHGLPVEVQVEKKLGLKSKREIEDYGIAKFVEECRESVFTHIKEWDRLTERMAYWIDLEKPYVTMDNNYIESVWWSLKKMWEKDLLYEGYRIVPYCARCGTPLSSHEVAQGYESVKEETVIVTFPAKDADYSLLAWTTTPWTLLSNVALAVNPDVRYAVIKYRGEKYVLAKNLAQERFPEADVIEELEGSELEGVEYYPLFNHFQGKLDKPAWRVITGDFVSTQEGTGIVHIAPAFGEDDYQVGQENNLPMINPVTQEGAFSDEIPEYAGVFVKDADPKIIEYLRDTGRLIAQYPYTHDYPFCWRCKTPLLYYSMKSWFIKVSEVVPRLLEKNNEISWYPDHIRAGRFGKWLENARDWSLSRNRFWGTPLPIWECPDCESKKAVGSRKELAENASSDVSDDLDLHRPYVDEIRIKCGCGKDMERVPYVIDCWYDSGSAPFAQFHHPFENKETFEKRFPYDFISEATDQTRGWFYTLLVISTILFDEPAYKSCVVGGLLLDDKGEKMSKSSQNIIDPWQLFDTVGVDAVRMQMCSTAPWNAVRFGSESLNESVIPLLRTLWNCYSFTTKYIDLDGFDPEKHEYSYDMLRLEDKWINSSINKLVKDLEREYSENNYHIALNLLNQFITEDLSRWYIKLIRGRLWIEEEEGEKEKTTAYVTLINVFEKLARVMAPLTPFISEEIYQNLSNKHESVHLAGWPEGGEVDEELNQSMQLARKIFEAGSNVRQQAGIKLRHPIACLYVTGDDKTAKAVEKVEEIIKKQLNTKTVKHVKDIEGLTYEARPDFKQIGPEYGKKAGDAAKAITSNPLESRGIKASGKPGEICGYKIAPEMILEIRTNVPDGITAQDITTGKSSAIVYIETERSRELLLEGYARDLIRNIQQLRKKRSLKELQRINIKISDSPLTREILENHGEELKKELRADEIKTTKTIKSEHTVKLGETAIGFDFSF